MKKYFLLLMFVLMVTFAQADLGGEQARSVLSLQTYRPPRHAPSSMCGSAFFFQPQWVLTAAHVIAYSNNQQWYYFTDGNGKQHRLQFIYMDRSRDIALLYSPDYTTSNYIKIGNDMGGQNTPIMAYGNFTADTTTNDGLLAQPGKITQPKYSRHNGRGDSQVWPGFSGGPVIKRNTNEVLGIVSEHRTWDVVYVRRDTIANFLNSINYGHLLDYSHETQKATKSVKSKKKQ